MPTKLPSFEGIFKSAVEADEHTTLGAKALRKRLAEEEGFSCSKDEWDGGLKDQAQKEWKRLLANHEASEESAPAKKKRKTADKPSKYDRASQKNFETFTAAVVGDVFGGLFDGDDGSDEDGDVIDDEELVEDDASQSGSAFSAPSSSPEPSKRKKTAASKSKSDKPAGKTKKATKAGGRKKASDKAAAYKSAEFVSDSDDSSHDVESSRPMAKGKGRGSSTPAGDSDDGEEDKPKKGKKRKSGGGEKEKKPKAKKEKKAPSVKEGDAPRGSEADEARITKLKALLTAASGPRAFTAATGAERKLSVDRRTEILEGLLGELGLPVVGGKLPQMAKAKEIGEQRALDKEMSDLRGNPSTSGLRDGKHVSLSDSDGELDTAAYPSASARKKQVLVEREKFGAFLGDQSSDSD
ncbi:hypothetical protein JCM10207_001476 [Rhodosporidiobolus poonsookiae]